MTTLPEVRATWANNPEGIYVVGGAGEFGVPFGDGFDDHAGGSQKPPNTAHVDLRVDQLADHLREVRRSQSRGSKRLSDHFCAGFIVQER